MWTGPPTDIGLSACERDYSPWQCLNACNSITFHRPWHYLTRPYHIPCDARQAIAYTMPRPPGHTIYYAVHTRPYHTVRPCNIPCYASPDHTYIILCPLGHTICHAMPTRPYHIPCHARQAIPYTIVSPYHIPCHASPGHNIYHAMTTRPYHTCIPYHAPQVIPYTMPCRGQRLLR